MGIQIFFVCLIVSGNQILSWENEKVCVFFLYKIKIKKGFYVNVILVEN